MQKRTRLFLVVAIGVLVLGLGTGLLASYGGFGNLTLLGGLGSSDLAYVPADAKMVAFADVHDLATSELRQKVKAFEPNSDGEREFEKQTGINIERDIDRILAAGWAGADGTFQQGHPLVLARGRFDTVRIEGLVLEHGGQVQDYKGKRLVVLQNKDNNKEVMAVGFIESGLVAAGDLDGVKRAIDTKAAGTGSVTDNAELMKLIDDVDEGNAWAVARFDALAKGPLPQGLAQQLPPITWFSASGYVDGGVRGTVKVEAKDEKSAADLREVVRGFMALARLQAGQNAQFSGLVNSLELGGQGSTVSLSFEVPSNIIDALGALTAQRRRDPRSIIEPKEPAAPARPAEPSL